MALKQATRLSDAQPFKFERRGDSIKGYYVSTTEETINGQKVKKHVFQTAEGRKSVLGQADMYKQLQDNNCLGVYVEITFSGNVQKLKAGRTMKLYDVAFDSEDTVETAGITGSTTSEETQSDEEESDILEDEPALDEVKPAHTSASASRQAKTPSAESQARVQALLNSRSRS